MLMRFREDRTTQAAALLLKLRGGKMAYMKLLKLLYLADRKALAEMGRPITFDHFVSMPHGPVLSRTLELMTDQNDPSEPSYWSEYISAPANYEVRLLTQAPNDQLSAAEEALLARIFDEFGHLGRFQIRDYTHTLREWRDPNGSSLPIAMRDVLLAQGVTEDDAAAIEESLEAEAHLEEIGQ